MGKYKPENFLIFNPKFDTDGVLYQELEKQLIKKNLYCISLYYRKITMIKLENLLENQRAKIEDLLCDMIYQDLISGKIDRLTETLII